MPPHWRRNQTMLSTDQPNPGLHAFVEQVLEAERMLALLSQELTRCERQVRGLGLRATTEACASEGDGEEPPVGSDELRTLQAEVNRNFGLLRGHADRLVHDLRALTAGRPLTGQSQPGD